MIKILLADDHTIVRDGLKRILEATDDLVVADEAVDGFAVLTKIRAGKFDLLLLDMSMPGKSGIELIKQIKTEQPCLPILVLTMHDEEQYAVRAIRAGAAGYLTKESASSQLVHAIRKVAAGGLYIGPTVAEQLALNLRPTADVLPHKMLSDREFEVFELLVNGKSVGEIANQLHLSIKTVSTHKTHIMQKMQMHSLADLVYYAASHKLVTNRQ